MLWPGFFNNQVAMTIIAEEIGRGDPKRLHVAQEDGEARGLNCLFSLRGGPAAGQVVPWYIIAVPMAIASHSRGKLKKRFQK